MASHNLPIEPAVDSFATVVTFVGVAVQWLYNDPTVSVVVAGMAGGSVRWYTEKEHWKTGLGSVFIGGVCAKYLGPFVFGMMERIAGVQLPDEAGTTGAFGMGLGGILIIKYIMDKFRIEEVEVNQDSGEPDV